MEPNENYTLDEYQRLAMRTNGTTGERECLSNAALGLTGEGGEFADTVKKILHHGHPLDDAAREHMAKELGDALWYVAQGAHAIGKTLGQIGEANIEKLRKRYPDGFSAEASRNRDMADSLTVDGLNATGIPATVVGVVQSSVSIEMHKDTIRVRLEWSDGSQSEVEESLRVLQGRHGASDNITLSETVFSWLYAAMRETSPDPALIDARRRALDAERYRIIPTIMDAAGWRGRPSPGLAR